MTKSVFLEMFGETPFIKVVDFFLDNDAFDYSKSDIARETGVSRITLEAIIPKLLKVGIIRQTRTVGKSQMYQFDKNNPAARRLLELDINLSSDASNKRTPLLAS